MDLPTFERLVNDLGLVRMKLTTEGYTPYRLGDIAGFPPDRALQMYAAREAVPADENGVPIPFVTAQTPIATPVEDAGVVIPEGWETLHHLRRVNLARQIVGGDKPITVEAADSIIRTHLER